MSRRLQISGRHQQVRQQLTAQAPRHVGPCPEECPQDGQDNPEGMERPLQLTRDYHDNLVLSSCEVIMYVLFSSFLFTTLSLIDFPCIPVHTNWYGENPDAINFTIY